MKRRKNPNDMELDIDELIRSDKHHHDDENYQEPDSWTIITALDRVLDQAEDSQLKPAFWETCKNPLAYLRQELGLTDMQIVVIAYMIEAAEAVTWKRIGQFLGSSRLSVMVYTEEIDELIEKRWLIRTGVHELCGHFQGFKLAQGVVTALRHNKTFVPEKIDGLTEQQFVDKLEKHVGRNMNNRNIDFCDDEEWMLQLVKANPTLPLCQEVLQLDDIHEQSLLLMIVFDYAQWEGSEGEGLQMNTIENLYADQIDTGLCLELVEGTHTLFQRGLIEHRCVEGHANTEQYMLTRRAKAELLANYKPSHTKCRQRRPDSRLLKSHKSIKEKTLYFNAADQQQVNRLASLLSVDSLPSIQQRLEEQGMRKGFACLFYGAPGTGKTETVLQIARQTGRDIMQVDIANIRDKYVGESEKNIKEVFQRYRWYCRNSKVMPILFFNEADAIFGKRATVGSRNPSLEQMENAMQNIILQEIEDLEGILIATTNLTCNFDNAFERRFLYKVEFHKPDTDVKTQIWRSMIKDISLDDARQLATRFDFSGGQIENIARKRTVDYILNGKYATLPELEDFCRAEQLSGKDHRTIGFYR